MALVLACSSGLEGLDRTGVSPEELLAGTGLGATPGMSAPVADNEVLAVSAAMRAFLDEHVHPRAADQVKLHELIDAIINTKTFALEFDDRTRTASEAFERRTGNCLSFSNLFVAMAREVGLAASFQEVDLPPDWSIDRDVFVLNRHVNVRVDLDPVGVHVVDFNIDDFRASYATREISDTRARAHYYNNMGVEAMQAGGAATAVAYFRKPLNLMEVDSRLRAYLGEDAESLIDGRVLVVGQDLQTRLADRLARFQQDDVARNDLARRNLDRLAGAAHPDRRHGQPPQRRHGPLGAVLLEEPQNGEQHHDGENGGGFDELAQKRRNRPGGHQDQHHGCGELLGEHAPGPFAAALPEFIRAVGPQPFCGGSGLQTGFGAGPGFHNRGGG